MKNNQNEIKELVGVCKNYIKGRNCMMIGAGTLATGLIASNNIVSNSLILAGSTVLGLGTVSYYQAKKWAKENYRPGLFHVKFIMNQAYEEVNEEVKDIVTLKKFRKR